MQDEELSHVFSYLLTAAVAVASHSTLADGTEFPSWEKAPHFSQTYYVDGQAKKADDKGTSSKDRPCRTIKVAAQVLRPGECGARTEFSTSTT